LRYFFYTGKLALGSHGSSSSRQPRGEDGALCDPDLPIPTISNFSFDVEMSPKLSFVVKALVVRAVALRCDDVYVLVDNKPLVVRSLVMLCVNIQFVVVLVRAPALMAPPKRGVNGGVMVGVEGMLRSMSTETWREAELVGLLLVPPLSLLLLEEASLVLAFSILFHSFSSIFFPHQLPRSGLSLKFDIDLVFLAIFFRLDFVGTATPTQKPTVSLLNTPQEL